MGCWSGTCAISNLPIQDSEPVKLIFLQGEYKYFGMSAFYDSTDYMEPAFYPIDAKYNDYGSIDNITENWNTELINNYFKKRYGNEIKQKHNHKAKVETTIETVANLIERGLCCNEDEILEPYPAKKELTNAPDIKNLENLEAYSKWLEEYVNNTRKENKPLSFVLVRKDVWDSLVKIMGNYKENFYYSNFFEVEKHGKYGSNLNEKDFHMLELEGRLLKYKEHIEKLNKLFDSKEKLYCEMRFMQHDYSPFYSEYSHQGSLILRDKYHDIFFNNLDNEELKNEIIKDWLEYKLIIRFMTATRKAWSLHPGAGSQSTNWEIYAAFSKIVNEIAIEKVKEYEDDEE